MSSIIDEINQAMPPGAVLDVTLETVQNLATALLRARAHIIELQDLYQRAKDYSEAVQYPKMPELSTDYLELRDAIDSASRYRGYSDRIDDDRKQAYQQLLKIQSEYFTDMVKPKIVIKRDSYKPLFGDRND